MGQLRNSFERKTAESLAKRNVDYEDDAESLSSSKLRQLYKFEQGIVPTNIDITPNTHALAKQYGLMDNYYASGKSSAEGHQWTDAGMVSDYVEKNVRAWLRSYPHRQADALVYNKAGFIWNHALSYGKSVKVYGEACETEYNKSYTWKDLYSQYLQNKKLNTLFTKLTCISSWTNL